MSNLEKLAIKLCESLPLDVTLHEQEGVCKKPNNYCRYCDNQHENYLCTKKTLTPDLVLV